MFFDSIITHPSSLHRGRHSCRVIYGAVTVSHITYFIVFLEHLLYLRYLWKLELERFSCFPKIALFLEERMRFKAN